MRTLKRAIVPATLALLLATSAGLGKNLLRWDFEDDDPFHHVVIEGEKPEVVADPTGGANKVMRSYLTTTSERPERSEVRWDGIKAGQERWLGVRILVMEPAQVQPFCCLFQLGPIKYRAPFEKNSGGYFQYIQQPKDGTPSWKLRGFGDFNLATYHGPVQTSKWTKWVFHFKTSEEEDGILEIWKDGVKIYEKKGRNVKTKDYMLLPIKWGVYIGVGNKLLENLTVYHDDILLDDEECSLEEMMKALGG